MSILSKDQAGALILEDGTVFPGEVFSGVPNMSDGVLGEVVFNTAMSGYQEILTDPSYLGQIVVMTYPHIGNYGINLDDNESRGAFVSGFIAHEFCDSPSNWRSKISLKEYFQKNNIPALTGVDTRSITRHLRDKGAMNAFIISHLPSSSEALNSIIKKLKSLPPFGDKDLVSQVSCKEPYDWHSTGNEMHLAWNVPIVKAHDQPLVAVLDLGVKHNMLRNLVVRGCRVKVLPVTTSASEILKLNPKGVLLSNGPGDPAKVQFAPNTVRELLGKVPVFGICMGHQILAHAIGAKTYKMKFGHHGANQPVLDIQSGRVMITSQNHGYSIDPQTLPKYAKVSQTNLNDQSVEGIELSEHKAFSVQYHPEACPGPRDSMIHFDNFLRMMGYV